MCYYLWFQKPTGYWNGRKGECAVEFGQWCDGEKYRVLWEARKEPDPGWLQAQLRKSSI